MAVPEPQQSNQEIVTIDFPGGREHAWPASDSLMRQWHVGQHVTARSQRWVVLARSESAGRLVLTLGVGSHDGNR